MLSIKYMKKEKKMNYEFSFLFIYNTSDNLNYRKWRFHTHKHNYDLVGILIEKANSTPTFWRTKEKTS